MSPNRLIMIVATALLCASGCTMTSMQVPKDLAKDKLMVRDEGGFLKARTLFFPPWVTADVERDWTRSDKSSLTVVVWSSSTSKATQNYRFKLRKYGEKLYAIDCQTRFLQTTTSVFDFGNVKTHEEVGCHLKDAKTAAAVATLHVNLYTLHALNAPDEVAAGEVRMGDTVFTAHAVYRSEQATSSATPLGVVFRRQGKAVAAFQLVNKARIWIAQSLSDAEQNMLAGAIAGLAQYETLEQTGEAGERAR